MINIIGKRKIYYSISGILLVISLFAIANYDLRLSIDFQGGSLLELQTTEQADSETVRQIIDDLGYSDSVIQIVSENNILIRTKSLYPDRFVKDIEEQPTVLPTATPEVTVSEETTPIVDGEIESETTPVLTEQEIKTKELKSINVALTEEEQNNIIGKISEQFGETTRIQFESIGPIIGQETTYKTGLAVVLASLFIILYIAYAFRSLPKPASSWRFGICAIAALLHDLLFVVGMSAILGHYIGLEIDALFVVALLNIMSFSVHDTIVSFDRIRENLKKMTDLPFEEVVNYSLVQTLVRSININLTVMFTLLALYLFGAESIKHFTLILLIGIAVGTYSSIFNASPLLVTWQNFLDKKNKEQ